MCAFSFTVFLSAFQLFPVAPFRMIDLGGTTFTAGLFLGCLTYASAFSAPFTGALADRFGRRRQLLVCSLVISALSIAYGMANTPAVILGLAVVHGFFWSGLLSANAAYTAELIPATRRTEGIGYHGMASVLAVALAPTLGLWVYRGGWGGLCVSIFVLNIAMAFIAWRIPDDRASTRAAVKREGPLVEWHVTAAAITLFLGAFGYGGVTSFVALMADQSGVRPRAWYFTVLALSIMSSRAVVGRLADRVGARRVLLPCLSLASVGYAVLALPPSFASFTVSAVLVGLGFGSAYPVFAAWVLQHVSASARGAAFGGILAALDTGIGTGSMAIGWLATHASFQLAFGLSAALSALSVPYFALVAARAIGRRQP